MPFPSARAFDHVVLPALDLEAQAAFYRRMGFQVGARNIHPWGTENRLVQFDGCFLELITLGDTSVPPAPTPRLFSFGHHVREWLKREGGGMSMLAIDSDDARADAAWLRQAGVSNYEPFSFGRKGQRPDGSDMQVAFTLAFATPSALPGLCFFACQHQNPEDFWNAGSQAHENGVVGIARVVVVHPRPSDALPFLKAYAGGAPAPTAAGFDLAMRWNGRQSMLSIWTPEAARGLLGDDPILHGNAAPRFAAIIHGVRDLDRTRMTLIANNVPHRIEKGLLLISSDSAFGVLTAFEQVRA